MGWKKNVPIAGALGAVVVGGVAMTLPASAATLPVVDDVTTAVQQVVEGGERPEGRGHRQHHRGGMRGEAVAAQLGIEVDTFRDAVKAVIEARQEAGEERPGPDATAEERLAARAEFTADVAAELGISAADLEAAFDAVFQAKLDEGVANGRLTQQEADEMLAAYESGTLHELQQERHAEALGDKFTQMLDNGVIDDAQYDALQAALAAEDQETLRELIREIREENGFEGRGPRGPRGHRGGPGGPGGPGAPVNNADSEGISL